MSVTFLVIHTRPAAPGDILEVASDRDERAFRIRVTNVVGHTAGAIATGALIDRRGWSIGGWRSFALNAGIPYSVITNRGWKARLREALIGRTGRHRGQG